MKPTRRSFLQRSAEVSAVAGLADLAGLNRLPAVAAQDAQMPRNWAAVASDVEPLVRMLEDTPRNRVIEVAAERVRGGTSYQALLAAVTLAGVRGIRPRPVGFKFHAVLAINAAHLASLASADRDRWLPLFWAFDAFKSSQEQNRTQGDWHMPALEANRIPDGAQAGRRFREAMDHWDESAADAAVAAWARTAGINEIYEAMWRYGARDFRDIGHKAIFAANSYRTLSAIGSRHAEPILRSLAFAMLEHEGTNPADRDDDKDRPWRDNIRRAGTIRADWRQGRVSAEASTALLASIRQATPGDASQEVVRLLNDHIDPQSIWDGLFLGATEMLMRQPGIVGLHCVTSMNALHFAYMTSADDETRRMMMLQGASFLPMFLASMRGRGQVPANPRIDVFEPAEGTPHNDDVFTDIGRDKLSASRKALKILQADPNAATSLMAQARRLVFCKGNDAHDYKFSSASLEDYFHVSPNFRNRVLAGNVFWLKGSGGADTEVCRRTREALNRA
ncbi:MAG TPA: hypothetical protein VHR72_15015 [Gemmataceae bacterium]|jgi:hypothetical protein|nr:hypothetical protein [Gemmataceae bacterium]